MDSSDYKLYKKGWVTNHAPHNTRKLSKQECRELLKKGGLLIRNTYDFDIKEETTFWYVIKDSFGGMEELSTKVRNQVRRALNTLDIRLISKDELLEKGYEVHRRAFENYKEKGEIPTRESFEERINSCNDEHQFWGCFDKTNGVLAAFSINRIHEEHCNYEIFKALPEYLKGHYPFYGLLFTMNKFYLEDQKLQYVCDGARSVTEHSNIQPFLIEKFKFRRAYCRLQTEYKWWLKSAVGLLYPLRKTIPVKEIKHILNLEAMSRGKS